MTSLPAIVPASAVISFERLNPLADGGWNERIADLPGIGVFHSANWARVLADTYGFAPVYFVCRGNGRIQHVLPVMEIDSWVTGRRGVSLPYTDACDIAGSGTREQREQLIQHALHWGRERDWKTMEFRGEISGSIGSSQARPSLEFYHHTLDLAGTADDVFSRLAPSTRRAVRKAENNGVTIACGHDDAALREFYRLHSRTRREHGLPPQPFGFFRNIQQHLLMTGMGVVISAFSRGRTIASAILLRMGNRAIYKFGASDASTLPLRANNLAMWAGIRWCLENGIKTLSFGRTSLSNEGLRRFKLGWGTREEVLHYFKLNLATGEFMVDHDGTQGFHTAVFRRLPVWANRIAGAALYRHLG